jgi:membrane fusion protein (multidrug efflux system)
MVGVKPERKTRTERIAMLFSCLSRGLLSLLFLLFCLHQVFAQPQKKGDGPPPALVEVASVVERQVLTRITLVGTAEPWLETVVASEGDGRVNRMLIEEGDRVKKGQALCEQDTTQLRLQIEAAKAELAEAEVLQAQAERDLARQKRLYEIDSIAEKAYDDAKFRSEATRNRVARLKAVLASYEDQLRKKRIKAPVAGYVVKRFCLVGQWLGEGQPVATLVVPDPIRFIVPVPERHIPSIHEGDMAQVTFDALPERLFEGKIDAIIPQAEAAARTFPVRVRIPNQDGLIKAGMLGRVALPAGKPRKALLVPKDALVLSGAGAAVYSVDGDKVRRIEVRTSGEHGALIEIEGEIPVGAKVVIRGNERLRPGQRVRIAPTERDPQGRIRQ